jgi:heme-degrading monooxygenase HmoA
MIAVIFEAEANEGQRQEYLDAVAEMRSRLAAIPGFIAIERLAMAGDDEGERRDRGAAPSWQLTCPSA